MSVALLAPWVLGILTLVGLGGVLALLGRTARKNQIDALLERFERLLERQERLARDEGEQTRRFVDQRLAALRLEVLQRLEQVKGQLGDDAKTARGELREMSEQLRAGVERQLARLTGDNNARLEEMRRTVAEKLEGTLERRLGDSFRLVSERLEQVHKGLGEMQTLAIGVGDLKKVMTNVKTRGTWGEIQLGSLLEQLLAPEQFERNVQTRKSSPGRVEFAIRMPGRDGSQQGAVWLPIDAKFPLENYQRLVEAQEQGSAPTVEAESRQLEALIKMNAREISDKYLAPPDTTDFAVMYLPTEGLFAEVARRVGLIELLQREHRIIVAGPTTLAALLNSLQMGFRTLAIQKRSSEVWEVLGAVKTEFGKFETVLKKVEKKLQEAGNVIESAHQRGRVIQRKLRNVESLPEGDTARLLAVPPALGVEESDDGADEL